MLTYSSAIQVTKCSRPSGEADSAKPEPTPNDARKALGLPPTSRPLTAKGLASRRKSQSSKKEFRVQSKTL